MRMGRPLLSSVLCWDGARGMCASCLHDGYRWHKEVTREKEREFEETPVRWSRMGISGQIISELKKARN